MSEVRKENCLYMATEMTAQCWCLPTTSGIQMDIRLAEAFRDVLANWLEFGAQMQENSDFYRGIVREVGEMFGAEAMTSEDGSVQDDVLSLKVPQLVRAAIAKAKGGKT